MKKLTLRFFIALLTFAIGVTAATLWALGYFHKEVQVERELSNAAPAYVPQGWQEVNMDGIVTFYLPTDLKQMIYDGCPGRTFYNQHMQFSFFYGSCSSGTCGVHAGHEINGLRLSQIMIDGRSATLANMDKRKFDLVENGPEVQSIDICIPKSVDDGANIAITAEYKDQQDLENINRIINSIKFP